MYKPFFLTFPSPLSNKIYWEQRFRDYTCIVQYTFMFWGHRKTAHHVPCDHHVTILFCFDSSCTCIVYSCCCYEIKKIDWVIRQLGCAHLCSGDLVVPWHGPGDSVVQELFSLSEVRLLAGGFVQPHGTPCQLVVETTEWPTMYRGPHFTGVE